MIPAARVFYLLAATSLLLLAGFSQEAWAYLALGLDFLLLLAVLIDGWRARATNLAATRLWPPLLVQGASGEVKVEIRQSLSSVRPVKVRFREGLHPSLAESPLRTELVARPGGVVSRWVYTLVPRRRGEPEAGPLSARVLGPWSLAWWERQLLAPEVHHVYPQVRWDGKVGQLLTLAQRHQLGVMPFHAIGTGTEPYALRSYLAGDSLSKIHWKATARHGRLIAREDTWERGARLVILLDCARSMASVEAERSKLDHSLAAALALTRVAAGRGDRVTLVAFSDRVERVVRVAAGAKGISRAYRELFDLEPRLAEPAYDLAAGEALRLESRSATVALFTSVVDLAAAELLREALLTLERRHRPLLVNLEDPELVALATEAPDDAPHAFAQVAALEIALANRRLATTLRRAGVRVVATPADRLALATLETYLALFRTRWVRGRAA